MISYDIVFARTARKELEAIDRKFSERIIKKIELLHYDPRPPGCEKIKGEENLWRIRIGTYRVIYSISDKEKLIDVSVIRHRKDAYK
jgi:mRNA interferase RelE/StbE